MYQSHHHVDSTLIKRMALLTDLMAIIWRTSMPQIDTKNSSTVLSLYGQVVARPLSRIMPRLRTTTSQLTIIQSYRTPTILSRLTHAHLAPCNLQSKMKMILHHRHLFIGGMQRLWITKITNFPLCTKMIPRRRSISLGDTETNPHGRCMILIHRRMLWMIIIINSLRTGV